MVEVSNTEGLFFLVKEDFPNVSKEAIAELDSILQCWLTQHCPINFYQVINTREYVISATDIEDYVDNS